MNILILVKDSVIGGVASCVKSLADGLETYKKVNATVASCEGASIDYMLKDLDVHIIKFDAKSPIQIIKNYREIAKLVKEKNIDIIHAQNRVPALYADFYHFFHRQIPYIWSNHLVPIPSDFLHRITTKYGSCAVAEGESGKRMLIEKFHIPERKVAVVNLGVDFSTYKKTSIERQMLLRQQYGIKANEKVILLYGRLHPVKGHLFLLDALKHINCQNYKLIFPGENIEYKDKIKMKAKEYGIEKNIIFPGFIEGEEWLSISDLMILPSRQEGFGIVNVEAFIMGVPVIRTKTGGYQDMKDLCFGVDFGDVKEMIRLLEIFFKDDAIFTKKAVLAKEKVYKFSLETYINGYYEIYRQALRR